MSSLFEDFAQLRETLKDPRLLRRVRYISNNNKEYFPTFKKASLKARVIGDDVLSQFPTINKAAKVGKAATSKTLKNLTNTSTKAAHKTIGSLKRALKTKVF